MWNEVVKKVGDVEAKVYLQPLFYVGEIHCKCPKGYQPSVKKKKSDIHQEHRDEASNKDKEKAKSHNLFSANQLQAQALKKG